MKPHRKMISKAPDAIPSFDTSTENFINTVTRFQYTTVRQQNTDTESSSLPPSNLSNFARIFFNFAYYLLLSPFRVVTDEYGRFVIKRWKPQQICCALMQIFCIIRLATEVRVNIERGHRCKSDSKNPVNYFQMILEVASFIYKLVTMKRLWLNQKDYLYVMNLCREKSEFTPNLTILKVLLNPVFLNFFFSLPTTLAFTSFVMGKKFLDGNSSWSSSLWASQLVKLARYSFFLDSEFSTKDVNLIMPISSADGFRAFIMAICMIQRYIHGLFCDLFILTLTMTLWCASKSFSNQIARYTDKMDEDELSQWDETSRNKIKRKSLTNTTIISWGEVYGHFRLIQQLSLAINTALGSQVTCYLAEAIMYYSIHLNLVLSSSNIFVRIDLAFFYFTTFGILFISADVCTQLESIKLWISYAENRKGIPLDEFSIILHEMIAKDVGIRGNNIFTITYSLLAMFFSTVVTYFIICVQQGIDPQEIQTLSSLNATVSCD